MPMLRPLFLSWGSGKKVNLNLSHTLRTGRISIFITIQVSEQVKLLSFFLTLVFKPSAYHA